MFVDGKNVSFNVENDLPLTFCVRHLPRFYVQVVVMNM